MSEGKKTLEEDDIVTERDMGRRSSIGVIGASIAAMAGILGLAPEVAEAQCTDSDGGRWADPGGRGRRCRRVYRRPVVRSGGCTDSDGGRWADPGGRGRRCARVYVRRTCSDRDGGRWADPGGRGRRC